MQSVLNIVVAAVLFLPSPAVGQSAPSAAQSATSIPKSGSQQPVSAAGQSSASATGVARRKPQKTSTDAMAGGSAAGKPGPAPATSGPGGSEAPKKIVVRQGGVREPSAQIVTDMDPAEATRRREDSERLLGLADENLKRLANRLLTGQQQETVSQIDRYMTVARSALKEGDISRGHTLALKANLLAVDLAKH